MSKGALPQRGGSYVQDAKGELTRKAHTERPPTREEAEQPHTAKPSKETS